MSDLIERLRALARCEHSDFSIGDEAADALRAAYERIETLNERLDNWERRKVDAEARVREMDERYPGAWIIETQGSRSDADIIKDGMILSAAQPVGWAKWMNESGRTHCWLAWADKNTPGAFPLYAIPPAPDAKAVLRLVAGYLSAELSGLHQTHPGEIYDALRKAFDASLKRSQPWRAYAS